MESFTSFAAYAQAAKLVEPTDRPFDYPTIDAQASSMFRIAFCQSRFDSSVAQLLAMADGVVRAVRLHSIQTAQRATAFAASAAAGA